MSIFANFTHYLSVLIILAIPVTGLIWLIDALVYKKKRKPGKKEPWFVDWAKFLFPVVLFVGVLRSFIIEPFVIPSGSMQPTLYAGDMIVADKWSYGVRMPITNQRLFSKPGEGIERGDVAIFKYPKDEKINYIKRVIGIPGDVIDYQNKQLTINGQPLEYTVIGNARAPEEEDLIITETMPLGTVDEPNSGEYKQHQIQTSRLITQADRGLGLHQRFPFTIPEGKFLMMGDNRDNSFDGRFWGLVDDEKILGKARFIWMNYNCVTSFEDCDHIFTTIE